MIAQDSTLQLHEILQENGVWIPINFASGCLVNYHDTRFVLTVGHAIASCTKAGSLWGVLLDYQPVHGTKYSLLPPFEYITVCKINTEQPPSDELTKEILKNGRHVDFGYRIAPPDQKFFTMWKDNKTEEISATEKQAFDGFHLPQQDTDYFFFGTTKNNPDVGTKTILSAPRFYSCKYWTSNEDWHVFFLPDLIKDEFDYKGCSGAPIFDKDHNLVSLVVAGKVGTTFLYGLNLEKYAVPSLFVSASLNAQEKNIDASPKEEA